MSILSDPSIPWVHKRLIPSRWERIKSYIGWEDYLGVTILLIGVLGLINGPIPYVPGLTDAYHRISTEMLGIGITVLIIDNANEAIKRREEKKRLILQMGSPDNAFAIEAVRQIRTRGWMSDGTLHQADLGRANLKEAILSVADLRGADLGGADLSGAKLERAKMRGADLRQAILSGVDLSFANLHQAYLNEVDLTRAILSGTFLEETDLREAKVTSEQLDKAKSLRGAILPDGTLYKDDDLEQI